MSNDITPFEFDPEEIPNFFKDSEQWFSLRHVCNKLGLADASARSWAQKLPKDAVVQINAADSLGRPNKQNYVNKRGIAHILRNSVKDVPRAFQHWLGVEVFESIVEDGGYVAPWISQTQIVRIREQLDYKQATAMLAQASDYDSKSWTARGFFASMQNIFHIKVSGLTAKELKETREIVSWSGENGPEPKDYGVGKNFLSKEELELSGLYLTYVLAHLALKFHGRTYTMKEFITELRDVLDKFKR